MKQFIRSAATMLLLSVGCISAFSQPGFNRLIKDLAGRSDVVLLGSPMSVHSKWSADRKTIRSFTRIEVKQLLKGAPDTSAIFVEQLGGRVDNIDFKVDHQLRFRKGVVVLLFLKASPEGTPNSYWILNPGGKFDCDTVKNSGQSRVILFHDEGDEALTEKYRTDYPLDLEAVKNEIRQVIFH